MTLLGPRRYELELIDGPDLDRSELRGALAHVAAVNRWLGGEQSLRSHLRPHRAERLRVLDVGTGDGTVGRRLAAWAERGGGRWRVVGVDLHPQVVALADAFRGMAGGRPAASDPPALPLRLVRADALRLPFADGSFDVALCTLTLHHFREPDASRLVSELARVATRLVIVSDLERALPSYLFARLFALTWWRRNPLTRVDGPLSVLRSFTPGELRRVAADAGLAGARVRRHFPFRLVLAGEPRDGRVG